WALSLACDHPFHFSADNLSQEIDASEEFKSKVTKQLSQYLDDGLPARAQALFEYLNTVFRNNLKVENPVCLPLV
ncbi:MAG: elongation factor P hydroxylase, partial [Kangiellaceae bacterium]|nr:elongation factor P hydroxylase [Kangiellaceae bacterium]